MRRPRLAATVGDYDVLLVVSLVWFLAKFVRYLFPPLFERFQADYGVSTATLGLLFTLMMVAYGAMQFPSGALGDRFGSTRVVVAGVCLVGLATIGLAASQALAVLAAAMVVIGVGTGLHKTVAIDLVATVYPERTGRMLGTMDAIGELAGVVAPAAVVAVLGAALGWSLAFLASGIAAVGLAAAAIAVARRHRQRRPVGGPGAPGTPDRIAVPARAGAYFSAFASPRFVLFVLVVMAFSFVWNGVTAFLPLYLTAAKGLGRPPLRGGLRRRPRPAGDRDGRRSPRPPPGPRHGAGRPGGRPRRPRARPLRGPGPHRVRADRRRFLSPVDVSPPWRCAGRPRGPTARPSSRSP